ncbi:MAG: quinone-dependent dihydroorotate dehydrogenase [Microscillaceae bacterium]|jgi:dihydroorotate dehydrogenase|nr:quinone-dependent dihydroorotate dehydrogenase [Microscillaceae bacterium]
MYKLIIQPLLFLLSAETAHRFVFGLLKIAFKIPGVRGLTEQLFYYENPRLAKTLMGLQFKNPIGLAAGFDKNAELIDEFAAFGFGFIEIGTVTPQPQAGNDKPRLFRLKPDQALVNRMGFNNEGVEAVVERLKKRRSKVIIGGNIGKNKITPNEQALNDYLICFRELFAYVDYFVVNVSSPNTPNLRALQEKEPLQMLLQALQTENRAKASPKPILLKIAPDLTNEQLNDVIEVVQNTQIAGVIATNTTVSRDDLYTNAKQLEKIGMGGLSGKPLQKRATEVIKYLRQHLDSQIVIIGVGGIFTAQDAQEKLQAGADLVQVYTGLVYEGAGMVQKIKKQLPG